MAGDPSPAGEPPAIDVDLDAVAGDPAPAAGAPAGDAVPPPPGYPTMIEGGHCRFDRKANGGEGLRLRCIHHHGDGCEKWRSVHLDPYGHGRRAAEFFLGALQQRGAGCDVEGHKKPPTKAEVLAYAAAHAD